MATPDVRVTLERDAAHTDIFEDDDFVDVIEAAARSREMVQFLGAVVRRFESSDEIRAGKAGGGVNLERFANEFFGRSRARTGAQLVVRPIERLYERHNPGNLRGTFIEAMAERRLRVRYYDGQLSNNVFLVLSNGVDYRSRTSVDVVGHDGTVGECLDCKARAKNVDAELIKELVAEAAPRGFAIGLTTSDSAPTASSDLRRLGLDPDSVHVVGPERWWDGLPLRPEL